MKTEEKDLCEGCEVRKDLVKCVTAKFCIAETRLAEAKKKTEIETIIF